MFYHSIITAILSSVIALASGAAGAQEEPPRITTEQSPETTPKASSDTSSEMVLTVRSKRRSNSAINRTEVDKQQISDLPEGDQADLSKVVAETTPGAMAGPMGQLFFRGTYEASAQYQLDGIQLPDLATARFGQIFPTQAVERLDVTTGAFPAEYGERLGGVVNIVTKSGGPKPSGAAEIKLGSYNTTSPSASYGGSLLEGKVHYFAALMYTTTSRGLNTPQPASPTQVNRGGEAAIHDGSQSNSEILKVDWIADSSNKLTLLFLNSHRYMQLPNFPASFSPSDPLFTSGDSYGNPAYRYAPSNTNDTQTEDENYIQGSWRHSFSDSAFLQISPYWKGSTIGVGNDLTNDLVGVQSGQTYSSFSANHTVSSFGLHADFTQRLEPNHRLKSGVFFETSRTGGTLTVTTATDTPSNRQSYSSNAPATQNQEAIYVQDDYTPLKDLTINAGVRANFTQLSLSDGEQPSDSSFQPRLGVSYGVTETTLIHAYYGRLYHNAPADDLRVAFNSANGVNSLSPYDVKSENADYYEAGLTQNYLTDQVASVTAYYRTAKNWIDDTQVPNTYITQPINFAVGYAKGIDFSFHGPISARLAYFANYSYLQAQVKGLSGGIFTKEPTSTAYRNLDTDQKHTLQTGLMWRRTGGWWWSVDGLYGSGLPTSDDSSKFLPAHLTFDASVGREFKWLDWNFKVSADVLNILDDPYPITIANGLVATQYAAGRQFFVRLGAMF